MKTLRALDDNWKRTFLIICTGQAFSLLSSVIAQFAIIWWITDTTGSAMVLTISTLAGFLPQGLCGPFVGALIDRWDRKVVMILADVGIALTSLVLAGLFFFGDAQLWHIYLILALRSIGSAFHVPAMLASVPLIVPSEQLTRAAGLNQAIQSVCSIAGPALGALALAIWPMSGILLIDVAGALLASATLLVIRIPRPEPVGAETQGQGLLQEVLFGLRVLVKSRGLLIVILSSAFMTLIYMPLNALFPLLVSRHFGGGAWHVSATEIAFGAGMLLGSVILGIWGGTKKKVYTICGAYLGMGVTLIWMGMLPSDGFFWFIAPTVLLGCSAPMFNGPFTAILQTAIEPAVQGRVLSVVSSMMLIATPLGLLAGGPLADRWGVARWFLVSGVLIVIAGIASILSPSVRRLEETF